MQVLRDAYEGWSDEPEENRDVGGGGMENQGVGQQNRAWEGIQ